MADAIRRVVTGFDATSGEPTVHRGPRHSWVNRGGTVCRLVCTSIAASLPEHAEPD